MQATAYETYLIRAKSQKAGQVAVCIDIND